ncbi:polyadenylate-binding protein-interacting protein 8-like isoform X2 [Apium graveolens]|uniref:polyadenylate-binding protein-interacting protein 8-like isoform X2 n=1 Tax=Apium graveolens TaxID=4045 RepID=UPI003D78E03D
MAAGAEMNGEAAHIAVDTESNGFMISSGGNVNVVKESDSKQEFGMQHIVDMLSNLKLNPMAKEFFPSYYSNDHRSPDQFTGAFFVPVDKNSGNFGFPNNRRRRNSFGQGKRRLNGRAYRAQREDSIRRTVYVSDIDHNVTEEQLAGLFCGFGQVVDCRVCGDPHSHLRFAFVEFADEFSARAALSLGGTLLGFSPVKVLPSKTAILPVNPTFLPKSEDEREMCARTVYCTNIDKKVSRLRLLGDHVHSTRIAFVEFVLAESAIIALDCCGQVMGSQPVRVSPSKTPVRPRVPRAGMH